MFVRTHAYSKPKLPLLARLRILFKRKVKDETKEPIEKQPSSKIVVSD